MEAFVKAEVVGWEELVECGGYAAARDKGLLRIEGRDYVVARRRRNHHPGLRGDGSSREVGRLGFGDGRRGAVSGVAAKAGHYESFYLKACRPGGGRGIWIRHTVHKRPGAEPTASVWFVLFDPAAAGPRAAKATFRRPSSSKRRPAHWIRVDDA